MNFIKKLLSHLFEIKLEEVTSELSGPVRVSLVNGRYCLSTKNAVYSNEDYYTSFKGAFEKLANAISTDDMRKLNYEVDGKKRTPKEVAAEWVRSN